jgi:hypothetical protein
MPAAASTAQLLSTLDLRPRRCSVVAVPEPAIVAAAASSALGAAAQLELAAVGGVLLVFAVLLLARELRRWRAAHPRDLDEVRARAVMGELCPNGWQAQITLYGSAASAPPEASRLDADLVALDWSELPAADENAPEPHRLWAPTIADALAAMVEDRRTDEVLERIERSANADDDPWEAI